MKARRYREGKIVATEITDTGNIDHDVDALGTIADLADFLEKVRRLRKEVFAPEGSLRDGCIRQIEYLTSRVEAFRKGARHSPAADSALLHLLHAACHYMNLMEELRDDAAGDRRKRITRATYLAALQQHRTQEAVAEALGVSVQGLRKWRRENIGR